MSLDGLCVVVPAKDERLGIGKTVRSILDAGVEPSHVYVVDDGSSDGTGEIAAELGVNVFRNEKNVGKATAIQRIATHFDLVNRYSVIALMDADTEVNHAYFDVVMNGFKDPKVAAVCGRAKSVPHNWLTSYRCLAYWISHAVYKGGQSVMGVITVAPGCAASYRADVFARLNWNRDTIVEDMDCTIQIHRAKMGKIIYVPEAEVYTQDPNTVRGYVRQMYRWHTGAWQIGKKYGMITGLRLIDWEYKLLMGEGLIFATLFLLTPFLMLLHHTAIAWLYLIEIALQIGLSIACAIFDKRTDVIWGSPLYISVRFIDCGVFLYSFWKTIIQKQQEHGWFAVKRY